MRGEQGKKGSSVKGTVACSMQEMALDEGGRGGGRTIRITINNPSLGIPLLQAESGGRSSMPFSLWYRGMFDLVDTWTEGVSP